MRIMHAVLLIASVVAIAAALSDQPMRWFLRTALLVAGTMIGLAVLRRIRRGGSPAANQIGEFSFLRWGWSALVLIFWSKILALAFRYLGRDALHYFRFEESSYGPLWPRRVWLLAHICGGMLALLLGPAQFWSGLRGTTMKWHRWTGRAYGLGVLLAAGSAFHLGCFVAPEEGGLRSGGSMMVLATVWLIATAMAIRAILHRRIESHREWMTRSYVLAFAFVNIRWLIELPVLAPLGTPNERIPAIIWASWAVPLFVTEVALQWHRAGTPENRA